MVGRKLKKLMKVCLEGEITVPKTTCWLVGTVCLLAGIVYGMKAAPFTHGITIGSNNGNQTNCGWEKEDLEAEEKTEANEEQ